MERDPDFMVALLKVWVCGRQFADSQDYLDGNRLRVSAECGDSGTIVKTEGPFLHLGDVAKFLGECEVLHQESRGVARLRTTGPNLAASLEASDSIGGIEASIQITSEHPVKEHSFTFAIDQNHLPYIIRGLKAVLDQYPIRGRPAQA
ncbi:MAG: hypothetical protein GY725_26970 [bacterium]|nr:hypothetical protein [bacterium]